MNDLLTNLSAVRREQNDSVILIDPKYVEQWTTKAKAREAELRKLRPAPETDEYDELESIISYLDEIQQRRAYIIWEQAFDQVGDVSKMTATEAAVYQSLIQYAALLKGEE